MSDITTYAAKNCQVSLDGRDVRGLWEGDDAVQIERGSDRATHATGADGKVIVSTSADETAMITLRLQHTSAAHQRLRDIERAMSNGSTRKFPISVRDLDSGEGGSAAECVIMTTPSVNTGSAAAGVREWTILAGRWEWNAVTFAD